MAVRHVEAIRAIQPRGPYRLGGLCNGGLVALEVARRLGRDGERVDALVLVAAVARRGAWARRLSRRLVTALGPEPFRWGREVRDLVDATRVAAAARPFDERARRLYWEVLKLPRALRARRALAGPAPGTPAAARASLRESYLRSDREYAPERYDGRVTVLWPADDPITPEKAARTWSRLARAVELRVLPGSHLTCLTVHAAFAARQIERCLEDAGDATTSAAPR